MNIHEYQAKELLRKYNVPVPDGEVAFGLDEIAGPAKKFIEETGVCVVKAQIHAGGRGKAGGVKLAKTVDEARKSAEEILGATLVTHQTGPEGKVVHKLLIEQGCQIDQEFYVGFVIDRASQRPAVMVSPEGGMEIEEVAANSPEKIKTIVIDPVVGLQGYQGRELAFFLGLDKSVVGKAVKFFMALYKAFDSTDADMIEINPMVLTKDGNIMALDAKISFDSNALYRHKDIEGYRDLEEEDPKEVEASHHDLNYVALDGNIGCMVNGAGLAMSTMDIIKFKGGEPANFLDVGGGATKEQVVNAFKIITADDKVKAVLVNIFGGIMKCDIIAEGIKAAAEEVGVSVPLIVRLQGTNAVEGRKILDDANFDIITAETMGEAAEKAVNSIK